MPKIQRAVDAETGQTLDDPKFLDTLTAGLEVTAARGDDFREGDRVRLSEHSRWGGQTGTVDESPVRGAMATGMHVRLDSGERVFTTSAMMTKISSLQKRATEGGEPPEGTVMRRKEDPSEVVEVIGHNPSTGHPIVHHMGEEDVFDVDPQHWDVVEGVTGDSAGQGHVGGDEPVVAATAEELESGDAVVLKRNYREDHQGINLPKGTKGTVIRTDRDGTVYVEIEAIGPEVVIDPAYLEVVGSRRTAMCGMEHKGADSGSTDPEDWPEREDSAPDLSRFEKKIETDSAADSKSHDLENVDAAFDQMCAQSSMADITAMNDEIDQMVRESKKPPSVSEEEMHKLKRQYPGDPDAQYGTAWKIHKLREKKK